MIEAALALIDEVDEMGGMTKAVASGMPKLRIEEGAARRQAAMDRGDEVIVGVNKFRLETRIRSTFWMLTTWQFAPRKSARLEQVRGTRDQAACDAALGGVGDWRKG